MTPTRTRVASFGITLREDIKIKTQTFPQLNRILIVFAAFALVAFALIALPTQRAAAQTAGQGKIEGQITNATKDAKPGSAANLDVTLVTFSQSSSQMITTTVKSDANGKFVFANLDIVTTTRHVVTTNYNGVDYFSDVLAFTSPASTTLSTRVSIFETTNDPSVIQVVQTHLVMDVQIPWLEVQQIVILENTSDRVFTGAAPAGLHRPTLLLPVLPKAIDIAFDDQTVDSTTLRGDEVLTYTLPIGPGKDQIIYSYAVPASPPTYEFAMKLPAGSDKLGVYMVDLGQTVQSAQLQPSPSPMSNVPGAPKFISIAGEKFTAGTTVKATVTNLPTQAAQPGTLPGTTPGATSTTKSAPPALPLPVNNTQLIAIAVLAAAIVAGIGLIAYPLMKRQQEKRAEEEAEAEEAEAAESEAAEPGNPRMELLQQIADLDDEFEAGKITETEYKERRAAIKAKLVEMQA